MAVVGATFGGAGILVATTWLLIRGGTNVGQHLSLLRNYLPGYSVSWTGALVGSVYGVLIGGSVGWLTARIYNRIVDARHSDRYHGTDSAAR